MSRTTLLATSTFSLLLAGAGNSIGANNDFTKTGQDQPVGQSQFGHDQSWVVELPDPAKSTPSLLWSLELGEGRSQVVGDDVYVYVCHGSSEKVTDENTLKVVFNVSAIEKEKGKVVWTHTRQSTTRDNQQTFMGADASPQSTPLLLGDSLIAVSFTGEVTCLKRNDGRVLWEFDAVEDFGAEPVQFGFSSSPIPDQSQVGSFAIWLPGPRGGLYKIDSNDGSVIWKSPCEGFSYSTPVSTTINGVRQWVVFGQNEVMGIRNDDGTRLWSYELSNPGQTNVPTPLVMNNGTVIVSGQGIDGTTKLRIENANGSWTVEEVWHQTRVQFFYSNWCIIDGRYVVGCNDAFLSVLDASDGSRVGKYRGFTDGNIVAADESLMMLDGEGNLSFLEFEKGATDRPTGFSHLAKFHLEEGRFWTPPTMICGKLFVRHDGELLCCDLKSAEDDRTFPRETIRAERLMLDARKGPEEVDYVSEIFRVFTNEGQEATFSFYSKLRTEKKLTKSMMEEIAEAARQQGLAELAGVIGSHIRSDFPTQSKTK